MKGIVTHSYRLFFIILSGGAIIIDIANTSQNLVNFFSYFTIISNLMLITIFTYLTIERDNTNRYIDLIRGAVVLYMLITGIVYIVLLDTGHDTVLLSWVSIILHKIMPPVALIDWIINPPINKLVYKDSILWLAFPALYLIYVLIRGIYIHWYPYQFLNPQLKGYLEVVEYSLLIGVLSIILGIGLIKIKNLAFKVSL